MSCNCNKPTNIPCGCEPCEDTNPECSCPIKDLSTDCVLYTGDRLSCSGIETDTILTDLIVQLDEFICDKFNEAINYLTLTNVGSGAEIYKGISGTGEKQIRSLTSSDNSVSIIQNENEIDLSVLLPSSQDTFVQDTDFNESNQELLLDMNIVPNHTVDLSFLNNHLNSLNFNTSTNVISVSLIDGSIFTADLSTLQGGNSTSQIKSDYLELNSSSVAFIDNKNPNKTITNNYTLTSADNNYIIEVDTTNNNVIVDLSSLTENSNYFVGFVKKGDKTNDVVFTGQDSLPEGLTNEIFGNGHMAAVEIINGTKYLLGSLKII